MNVIDNKTLQDSFTRSITYLRLSVIEQCNFRCFYCMPEQQACSSRAEHLTVNEIERLARIFISLGVERIRLTGGEPLLRHDLIDIAEALGRISGLKELTLSTNGFRLKEMGPMLKNAGVGRVNISLDTLEAQKFQKITGTEYHHEVLQGIDAALESGLTPVKLNMVVLAGINESEIVPMVEYAAQRGLDLRFIESMPIGDAGVDVMQHHLPAEQILLRVKQAYGAELIPQAQNNDGGPARYFRIGDKGAKVGVISAVSRHFCDHCNRVRLTATGDLLTCLGNAGSVALAPMMRSGASDAQLANAIKKAVAAKPWSHQFDTTIRAGDRPMSLIGG